MKHRSVLLVGCGGLGSELYRAIRKKYPAKHIYVSDYSKPQIIDGDSNATFIQEDLTQSYKELLGLDIDTLVITAGIGRLCWLETFASAEISKTLKVNSESIIQILAHYYPKIASTETFHCAVVTSIAGFISSPLYAVYSASKAALAKFIEAANAELSAKDTKNRILDVAPGKIPGTAFHDVDEPSKEQKEEIRAIAEEMLLHMENRDEFYTPNWEQTYKGVLASYNQDPIGFGKSSLGYKLKGSHLQNKPKIKVGYLTGTFDLFHIGHLNLLRNAKKHCDVLVVGVHPDGSHKGKEVFIPLDERMEILRGIRYVDDVIVCTNEDTDAWDDIRFDYLFVGSDYKGTERFARYEKFLGERGGKVIYLPYTVQTSSTQLRAAIGKGKPDDSQSPSDVSSDKERKG